jgi:hypothetical protein
VNYGLFAVGERGRAAATRRDTQGSTRWRDRAGR